jgi:hypothetical protein
MKVNQWTAGLAAVGLITLPAGLQAEETMSAVQTALSSTTLSGYVNTSAHWDIGTGNNNAPGYAFNAGKQDGFNLNVAKISLERPLDEAQWAAGYKLDLIFGPDANALATSSDGIGGDFAIQQAFAALRAPVGNGLDFKVGVFDTIIGYEVFDAGNNPNYTRSWGYTIEPTTHTGVLMSYQFCESFSASVGIANTVGPMINDRAFLTGDDAVDKAESYKTYMGSMQFSAPEDWGFLAGSSLYLGVVNGFSSTESENQTSFYAGTAIATPVTGLTFGTAHDWLLLHDDPPDGGKHAYAHGLYLSLQATEKLSLHGRAEYAKVSQARVQDAAGLQTMAAEKMISLTGTVQYDLWQHVLSRVEVRWDHQAGGHSGRAFGGDGNDADGAKKNAVLVAANIIYQF